MPENRNNGSTRNGGNSTRNNGARRSSVRSASASGNTDRSAAVNGASRGTAQRSVSSQRPATRRQSSSQEYYEEPGRSTQPRSRSTEQARRSSAPQRKSSKAAKKKKNKVILFVVEFCILAVLLLAFWFVNQGTKVDYIAIDEEKIVIDEQVQEQTQTGAMKGYRNIALFGVDSRNGELDKNTRTDTIMIASINQDTKEVKLISIFRDTYLNLGNDTYNKANSAYAKGGPEQAINMLNMNLDMNITDFVTIGFDGLIDVIDAVGGIEIDVKESEIVHLNNYQISMVGKEDGKNAAGEIS